MKKTKRALTSLMIWAIVLYCTYWMVCGSVAHSNVVLFWAWIAAVVGPMSLSESSREKARAEGRSLPGAVLLLFRAALLFALAYTGHFLTAAAYLFAVGCAEAALQPVELKAEATP